MFLFCKTNNKHYIYIVKQMIKVMQTINETIAQAIAESIDGREGKFSTEVEGYREDDYYSGTGAWELFRTTGKSFAVCLSRSWVIFRLIQRMRSSVVQFSYEKIDGTLRKAKGTLRGVSAIIKGTGTETPKTVKYYDIEADGWRSFKIENLITIY